MMNAGWEPWAERSIHAESDKPAAQQRGTEHQKQLEASMSVQAPATALATSFLAVGGPERVIALGDDLAHPR